jgi:hypothetical protein
MSLLIKIKVCKHCGASSAEVKWGDKGKTGLASGLTCASCRNKKAVLQRASDPAIKEKQRLAAYVYATANRATIRAKMQARYADPKERAKMVKGSCDYTLARRKVDPLYYAVGRMRTMIRGAIVRFGYIKNTEGYRVLGTSYPNVLEHLCKPLGLGCINGIPDGFEVDHVYPVSLAYDEASLLRLNHYTNLQLLPAAENAEKSDFVPGVGVRARELTEAQCRAIIASLPAVEYDV